MQYIRMIRYPIIQYQYAYALTKKYQLNFIGERILLCTTSTSTIRMKVDLCNDVNKANKKRCDSQLDGAESTQRY